MSFKFNPLTQKLDLVGSSSGGSTDAIDINYDNSISDLGAVNVQDALDELVEILKTNATNEYYVDSTNGSDLNPGSYHYPYQTIQHAVETNNSDALIKLLPDDFMVSNIHFNGLKTRLFIEGTGTTDQHITQISATGAGSVITFDSQATRINWKNIQFTDAGFACVMFDLTNSGGRHYFDSCTFNLTNASSKIFQTGNSTANWMIFKECTFTQIGDTSIGTVTGFPLFYFQECGGVYGIKQGNNCTVAAFGNTAAPYIDHLSGFCLLSNADTANRDSSSRFINSTATLSAGNRVFLGNINTWSSTANNYGIINIPNCEWAMNIVSRNPAQDNVNEANRLTRGIRSIDIDYDNTGSGSDSDNVQDAIDENIEAIRTFESYSKNLRSYDNALNYTGNQLNSIVYDLPGALEITKTFNYSMGKLDNVVLSGDLPSGIPTTKTFVYSGNKIISATYT